MTDNRDNDDAFSELKGSREGIDDIYTLKSLVGTHRAREDFFFVGTCKFQYFPFQLFEIIVHIHFPSFLLELTN